ncbi:ComEC/Rec2 family competence protein [Collinsella sp. Sow4_E3]|uniref:ComEC/Rec2 family competence protein n=1 Tax=Collinsella sp. Sow4_E3 TaxID=3438776 RepID=UPI003F9251C1
MKLPGKKKKEPAEPERTVEPQKASSPSGFVDKAASKVKDFVEPTFDEPLPPKWKPLSRHREIKRRQKQRDIRKIIVWAVASFAVFFAIIGVGIALDGGSTSVSSEQPAIEKAKPKKSKAKKKSSTEPVAVAEPEPEPEPVTLTDLVVKFVDVGQGDASIIEFPDGKTMLIDTPRGKADIVMATLRADGRPTIDWLVATHPDADHIGGLDSVISSMDIGSIWAPEANSPTQTYTRFLTSISNKGMGIEPAYAGRQIATGENYSIDILWPQQGASYSEDNAYSIVIKVTYGQNTFLFTGDAPVEAQNSCVDGHVDVLKVSHHGSASGMSSALAAKLTPTIAVLSYGKNSYGHPTQVVLDALSSVGAQVYGTYVHGTVTVVSNGKDVTASTATEGTIEAASQDSGADSQGIGSGGGGSSGTAEQQAAPAQPAPAAPAADPSADTTVVITPTGSKYHRPGCRTTSRSKSLTEMTKSQAQAQGYAPCGVCNP